MTNSNPYQSPDTVVRPSPWASVGIGIAIWTTCLHGLFWAGFLFGLIRLSPLYEHRVTELGIEPSVAARLFVSLAGMLAKYWYALVPFGGLAFAADVWVQLVLNRRRSKVARRVYVQAIFLIPFMLGMLAFAVMFTSLLGQRSGRFVEPRMTAGLPCSAGQGRLTGPSRTT
ncbi:MAG: hypothetical protein R3E01_27735 [Pirellulaceae bacterium]|nr:hypothetical protein [Planctomycetales bacterium]